LPPHGRLLPPPLENQIPPPPKVTPLPLLINIVRPSINNLLASPIRDGLPFWSWYSSALGMIHGILRLCFLLKQSSSSSKGSPQSITIPTYIFFRTSFGDIMGLAKGSDKGGDIVGTPPTPS